MKTLIISSVICTPKGSYPGHYMCLKDISVITKQMQDFLNDTFVCYEQ